MITVIVLILIILIILIPILVFLWLMDNTDWDQEEDRLFCESYKDMQTTQSNQVASNPGII